MSDLTDILAYATQDDPRAELWEMVMGLRPTEGRDINNLFDIRTHGGPCILLYERIADARQRILNRLCAEDDSDIDVILDCEERICLLVALQMYQYGTERRADSL